MQAQELKRNIHRQQAEEVSPACCAVFCHKKYRATPKSLERDDTLRKGDGPVGLWWLLLIPVLILALYRAGVLSLQIATLSVGWNWDLPRWWRGQYAHLSGRLVRWFRPAGSPALRISIAGQAGSLSLEVLDRSGAVQYAWYGITALDTWADIRDMGPFSVRIRAEGFRGAFSLALEP